VTASSDRIRDPGLQSERTALAWNRTGLAVLANALLAARAGLMSDTPALTALGIALLIAAAGAVGHGTWRRRALVGNRADIAPSHVAIGLTALLALATCGIGLAAIATTSR